MGSFWSVLVSPLYNVTNWDSEIASTARLDELIVNVDKEEEEYEASLKSEGIFTNNFIEIESNYKEIIIRAKNNLGTTIHMLPNFSIKPTDGPHKAKVSGCTVSCPSEKELTGEIVELQNITTTMVRRIPKLDPLILADIHDTLSLSIPCSSEPAPNIEGKYWEPELGNGVIGIYRITPFSKQALESALSQNFDSTSNYALVVSNSLFRLNNTLKSRWQRQLDSFGTKWTCAELLTDEDFGKTKIISKQNGQRLMARFLENIDCAPNERMVISSCEVDSVSEVSLELIQYSNSSTIGKHQNKNCIIHNINSIYESTKNGVAFINISPLHGFLAITYAGGNPMPLFLGGFPFSVLPEFGKREYGGVVSPEKLREIQKALESIYGPDCNNQRLASETPADQVILDFVNYFDAATSVQWYQPVCCRIGDE